jgi:hypothetical protein
VANIALKIPKLDYWSTDFKSGSVGMQIEKISGAFLGCPYLDKPLGDGEYDRFRFDGFDCITYIETVIGLKHSKSFDDFPKVMDQIRYVNGEVGVLTRKHITSLDWIPGNERQGFCKDITACVAEKLNIEEKLAECLGNRGAFLRKTQAAAVEAYRAMDPEPDFMKAETARCHYLPILDLLADPSKLEQLQNGNIACIVRPNWDLEEKIGTNLNISHMGFVIKKADAVYFRHAGSEEPREVKELPLIEYIRQYADQEKTSVRGLTILEVC